MRKLPRASGPAGSLQRVAGITVRGGVHTLEGAAWPLCHVVSGGHHTQPRPTASRGHVTSCFLVSAGNVSRVVSAPEGGAGSSRTLASRSGVQEEVGGSDAGDPA